MSKEEAIRLFRELVSRYGLQWRGDRVPQEAWIQMDAVNAVLTDPSDRREALGLPR